MKRPPPWWPLVFLDYSPSLRCRKRSQSSTRYHRSRVTLGLRTQPFAAANLVSSDVYLEADTTSKTQTALIRGQTQRRSQDRIITRINCDAVHAEFHRLRRTAVVRKGSKFQLRRSHADLIAGGRNES